MRVCAGDPWGANAVLSGFYHVYERLRVDELPYFVNGAGGSWKTETMAQW